MKRALLPLLALATLNLAGCGGGGGGDDDEGPQANAFAGTYTAVLRAPGTNAQQGTAAFSIDDEGDVNGTINDNVLGSGNLDSGGIGNGGEFAVSCTFNGAQYVYVGNVTRSGNQFSGTLTRSRGGVALQTNITATRQ